MPIDDDVQERALSGPRSLIPFPNHQPTDVASVKARVEAEFWKVRAQMLIYHREVVAELDRLYEILYGTPPRESKKATVHQFIAPKP